MQTAKKNASIVRSTEVAVPLMDLEGWLALLFECGQPCSATAIDELLQNSFGVSAPVSLVSAGFGFFIRDRGDT